MKRGFLATLTLSLALCAQPAHRQAATGTHTANGCEQFVKHGDRAEARACDTKLTASPDAYLRAEGFWGIQNYEQAKNQFNIAIKESPQNPEYRVRFGRLFLERFNKGEATNLFQEALEIQKDYAPAYLGLALVLADGFSPKAVDYAQKALDADPKLLEAQELLAYLKLEDTDTDKAIVEADKAIAMSPEALDALAVRATIDFLNDKPSSEWMDRILKVNPVYGEAYSIVGHFFVINRRYVDGIAYYRKAIALNPQLWEAHAQLGVNLMRLGEEEEPRKELELCYSNHYTSLEVVNSLRLLDSYKNFETFKTPTTILRLHKKEACSVARRF